jgi:hypothetical protein
VSVTATASVEPGVSPGVVAVGDPAGVDGDAVAVGAREDVGGEVEASGAADAQAMMDVDASAAIRDRAACRRRW